jgi:two-component system, cell cycle response regulator DivK
MAVKVLVVEDNAQNLYLATYLLENAGYSVVSAVDGIKGVALAKDSLPDIVLMDILLPGVDGYEATRRLKSDPTTLRIPVVALTAYSMEGDEQAAIAAGCDGYISKPIDPSDFVTKVTGFLARHPGGSAEPAADVER